MDPIEEIGRHQICEQVGTESDTFGGHFGSSRHCWEAVRVTIKTNAVHPKRKGLYWSSFTFSGATVSRSVKKRNRFFSDWRKHFYVVERIRLFSYYLLEKWLYTSTFGRSWDWGWFEGIERLATPTRERGLTTLYRPNFTLEFLLRKRRSNRAWKLDLKFAQYVLHYRSFANVW